jgi:hypothetical protein
VLPHIIIFLPILGYRLYTSLPFGERRRSVQVVNLLYVGAADLAMSLQQGSQLIRLVRFIRLMSVANRS